MNEEIEYAEMLEIPVSTVNVVRKKRRRKHVDEQQKTPPSPHFEPLSPHTDALLRDSVIAQVNEKLEEPISSVADTENITTEEELLAEGLNSEGYLSFEPEPDRLHTVRLYASGEVRTEENIEQDDTKDGDYTADEYQNAGIRYAMKTKKRASRGLRIALNTELALACALCGTIFFTNVFMPNSAINSFFRAMHTPKQETVVKHYSDFELSPIVSLRSDAELNLSSTGVLSFTDDCCVYPAANGTVKEIAHTDDGLYTVKVAYTDTFTGVFYGLDSVYYTVGDEVKANVPIGYTAGNSEVQVTMYSGGNLLNCFELTEENCLAWISDVEE
ncbi:MAG: M23 family metallopeptidase [Clostridiales bacterium]|nr:M23 family metallopeptidase [Clostridiales bacterium]